MCWLGFLACLHFICLDREILSQNPPEVLELPQAPFTQFWEDTLSSLIGECHRSFGEESNVRTVHGVRSASCLLATHLPALKVSVKCSFFPGQDYQWRTSYCTSLFLCTGKVASLPDSGHSGVTDEVAPAAACLKFCSSMESLLILKTYGKNSLPIPPSNTNSPLFCGIFLWSKSACLLYYLYWFEFYKLSWSLKALCMTMQLPVTQAVIQ